jgi:hypothetical protein
MMTTSTPVKITPQVGIPRIGIYLLDLSLALPRPSRIETDSSIPLVG